MGLAAGFAPVVFVWADDGAAEGAGYTPLAGKVLPLCCRLVAAGRSPGTTLAACAVFFACATCAVGEIFATGAGGGAWTPALTEIPSLAIMAPLSKVDRYKHSPSLHCDQRFSATKARALAHPGRGSSNHSKIIYRLLLQKLENRLWFLIGLGQDRDTRRLQHVGLGQAGRLRREVRVLNRTARGSQVLYR